MAKGSGLFSSKLVRGLIIGIAAALVGVVLVFTDAIVALERSTWDLRVRMFARPSEATDDVIVVFVDQTDLERVDEEYGISWPWPRSVQGYLVDFARASGAASVVYDIVLEDAGWAGAADDMAFQAVVEQFGRFVYASELRVTEEDRQLALAEGAEVDPEEWPPYLALPGWTATGMDSPPDDMVFLTASFPEEFVTSTNGTLGFANQLNDEDGVFRRYRLAAYHTDQAVPSLAAAAILAQTDGEDVLEFDRNSIVFNGISVPVDEGWKTLLKYTIEWAPPTESQLNADVTDIYTRNTFSAWEVLQSAIAVQMGVEPQIPLDVFENKHVLVGLSASGLYDLRPTPLTGRAPGVTVHAQMLDNLLSGEFMRDLPLWASIVVIILLSVCGALAATYAEKTWAEALLILGFLALPIILAFGGYLVGYWVQFVVPLIAVFIAMAASNVANYATEGAAKRQIRGMFGRYLSPDVISDLEQNPEALELGGKEAEISIYFSDIQKFSTISTKLGPEDLVEFLNVYLTPMTNMILEEGGLIDKYEGDAIIAMWGAPRKMEDHAQRGLRSVLKCQAALDELRPALKEQIGTEVYQRIGMSSGKAIVGNMGSELRRDYTMIGDAVNLAARLEGANKAFGTYSMVSADTINAAGGLEALSGIGVAVRELGHIAVVGREDKPVRVYEPMQPEAYDRKTDILSVYLKGIELFQAGQFADAKTLFERIAGEDPAAASYVPRCEMLLAEPPADWNGVWVLTEKG